MAHSVTRSADGPPGPFVIPAGKIYNAAHANCERFAR